MKFRGRVSAAQQRGSTTAGALDRCADVVFEARTTRSVRPILAAPSVLWHGLAAMPAISDIHCELDDSRAGRYIRKAFGRLGIGLAMELPASYEDFLTSHDRANNLRKSIRRAAKAGVVCSVAQGTARGDPKLVRLVRKAEAAGMPAGIDRTELIARNAAGTIAGLAVILTSRSTALIVNLTLCNRGDAPGMVTPAESTIVRYALNAFAVRTAIDAGARCLLIQGGLMATAPGMRVYAQRAGYSPRRLRARS